MNGTEWTDPGQGATVGELWDAVGVYREAKGYYNVDTYETDHALSRLAGPTGGPDPRTNLNLIGPLTADDLKRIAEAK